jgi:DNA-binding LacI/PurR family transcriptional regulator
MSEIYISSGAQQVAAHLRDGLLQKRWSGLLPGRKRLATELGVSGKIVEAALGLLENEGLLLGHGPRRRREIVIAAGEIKPLALRVGILAYEPSDRSASDTVQLLHELREDGHVASIAAKTMIELDHDVERVARLVRETPADVWVVYAGSRDILQWFAENQVTAFAYAGRANRVPIAGIFPDRTLPIRSAVRRMYDLGHRRIVMLVREERRKPEPGLTERLFLHELETLGISTGPYNLPDWECDIKGFHAGLESLFRITPPTALIIGEAPFVMAAFQFCLAHGLRVPEDLSLLCGDPDAAFEWCQPSIAHVSWDYRPIVRRIVRWVNNVSQGKEDRRKSRSVAKFVDGGTIGPAPGNANARKPLA